MTVVCGDSHTATHGAFGALAFGIGTSEVENVLATQCLLQRPSKTFQVQVDGIAASPASPRRTSSSRSCAQIGIGGGTGYVLEYTGSAIRALDMEGRMTVCNMSIEARRARRHDRARRHHFQLPARPPLRPERRGLGCRRRALEASCPPTKARTSTATVTIDGDALEPMITWGTNPGMGVAIDGAVPEPSSISDPLERDAVAKALVYMGLEAGKPILGHPVNVVFIGSCTNSRISDLRIAAALLKGRKVNPNVRVMVVPGSMEVKRQAIAEGLPEIFRAAGCDWREPGCSMCIAMNGDQLQPGEYSVSTSNRNFEGRQGKGGRTFLASPLTAAASALTGVVTDVRTILMKPFTPFESRLVPLPKNNIDTDQIIPARFLKTTSKEGLDKNLFCDWRTGPRTSS